MHNYNIYFFYINRYDFYEKAVTFRPYQVDMLDPVTANFLGDNLRCWMQIQVRDNYKYINSFSSISLIDQQLYYPYILCNLQVGKGPQASEVSGIVKIGQTMTMVIGVKDDENKFDMMVSKTINIALDMC